MSMVTVTSKGNYSKTEQFLKKALGADYMNALHEYGRKGVEYLSEASPVDTGLMSSSWRYEIERTDSTISVVWHNDDIEGGCNVAILVQYGHGTRSGYRVQGRDFINPALAPIFDDLAEKCWKEVTS